MSEGLTRPAGSGDVAVCETCGSRIDVDCYDDPITGVPTTICADCLDAARERLDSDWYGSTVPTDAERLRLLMGGQE